MTCGAGASIANAGRLFRTGALADLRPRSLASAGTTRTVTDSDVVRMGTRRRTIPRVLRDSTRWRAFDARLAAVRGSGELHAREPEALPDHAGAGHHVRARIRKGAGFGRARGDAARSQPDPLFAGGQLVVQGERIRPMHRRRRLGDRDDGLREPREAARRSVPALRHEGGCVRGARDVPRHRACARSRRSSASSAANGRSSRRRTAATRPSRTSARRVVRVRHALGRAVHDHGEPHLRGRHRERYVEPGRAERAGGEDRKSSNRLLD